MRRDLPLPARQGLLPFPMDTIITISKAASFAISAAVFAAMVAGAARDYEAYKQAQQSGIPIPECANVSLLRPPCRSR